MTDFNSEAIAYCRKFDIPTEYFFEILHDQKVIPMIRGKAMEYNAFLILKSKLNPRMWDVQKLNLTAQTGSPDEDDNHTTPSQSEKPDATEAKKYFREHKFCAKSKACCSLKQF